MKNSRKTWYGIGLVAMVFSTLSCEIEGCTDPLAINYNPDATEDDGSCFYEEMWTEEVIDGTTYLVLDGTITESVVLDAGEMWLLSGPTFVESGATLTIMPGTTIYTDGTENTFLSIHTGAMIAACGTEDEPIVFTPMIDDPEAGYWGGLVLNGLAPINNGPTYFGESGTGEYGGYDEGDSSGSLCYVRVEYAGKLIGDLGNEMNAFSFNGCGSGTELNHLQAYMCKDDGIEFFGGTVSLRYAVSTGYGDDGFDWQNGWTGNGQFWVAESNGNADEGIEGYNYHMTDVTLLPYSNPKLSNLTIVSLETEITENGMHLSSDTKGNIMNAVVHGFGDRGVHLSRDLTVTQMETEELKLTHCIIDNNNPLEYKGDGGAIVTPSFDFEDISNNNAVAADGSLVGFLSGIFGTTGVGATNPTSLDLWFLPAIYIGAIPDGDDWTAGWTIHL